MIADDFPQKNRYRAKRRKLLQRKKERAKRLVKWRGWFKEGAVKLAEHLQFCSKECCHNPRAGNSHTDKTLQELRAELKEHDA